MLCSYVACVGRRSTPDSGRGFFRRLSSSQTSSAEVGARALVAAARREEILHQLNQVVATLAALTATALEELRQKDPEVRAGGTQGRRGGGKGGEAAGPPPVLEP